MQPCSAWGQRGWVDISQSRVEFAQSHYAGDRIDFILGDIRKPLDGLGQFDFIWIRFVLEYYRKNALEILKNVTQILKPGGTLCIIDLDYNCLNHFPLPAKLEKTLFDFMRTLEEKVNFDPYAGRKLYSHLRELRYENLNVDVGGHHVIYGELEDADAFNWVTKVKVASAKIGFDFEEYPGGADEFMEEFNKFFNDPGRFTYTPVICARGTRPMED